MPTHTVVGLKSALLQSLHFHSLVHNPPSEQHLQENLEGMGSSRSVPMPTAAFVPGVHPMYPEYAAVDSRVTQVSTFFIFC